MTITSRSIAPASALRPRHPIALRIGLVLAAVLSILNWIPAVFDIGFDGTFWDVIVVYLAVSTSVIAAGTVVLLPFAWSGRRLPAAWIAALQLIAVIGLLPAFVLVFTDGLPLFAPLSAAITIALEILVAGLVLRGRRPPQPNPASK